MIYFSDFGTASGGGPPVFFAAGTAASAGAASSSIAPAYPTSLAADDILILSVIIRDDTGAADVSSLSDAGFAELIVRGQKGDVYVRQYWKRATGSESGNVTVNFSEVANNGVQHAVIAAYRNCKTSGTPYEGLSAKLQDATTAVVGPNVLTTDVDRLAVMYSIQPDISATGANDGSWTEDFEATTAAGSDSNISASSISAPTAGLVAANTRTMGSSALAYTTAFALLPVGAPDPTPAAVSLRASRIAYVNNANSAVFTLPTGSIAGDWCVIFVGHGFAVNTPSGWNLQQAQAGTNWNGAYFEKELSASDISTGSVTITFTGIYYGVIGGASFVKKPGYIRYFGSSRNSAGAASRALTTATDALVNVAGDYVLTFGSGRFNGTVTCDKGSSLQTTSNANASGALYGGTLGSGGSITSTVSYSATPTGDFQAIIIMAP